MSGSKANSQVRCRDSQGLERTWVEDLQDSNQEPTLIATANLFITIPVKRYLSCCKRLATVLPKSVLVPFEVSNFVALSAGLA